MKAEKYSHKQGRFYGVGVGPGDPSLLTLRGAEILQSVDVVFYANAANGGESVSKGIIDTLPDCCESKIELVFPMTSDMSVKTTAWRENALRVAGELQEGHDCAFATIGDPSLYSTYIYLLRGLREHLPGLDVETVPGISAFQAAAAKTNEPLAEGDEVLALVPGWLEEGTTGAVAEKADTVVFLKTGKNRDRILNLVRQHGLSTGIYAAHIGLENEVLTNNLDGLADCKSEYLSLLITRRNKQHSAVSPVSRSSRRPPKHTVQSEQIGWSMTGHEVEAESFRQIEAEMGAHAFSPSERRVVRRMIHASADFSIADDIHFGGDPIEAASEAIGRAAPIFCDSNMVRGGISVARLQQCNPAFSRESIVCYVGDDDVARTAGKRRITRSLAALEKARPILDGAIVLVGNAPLALAGVARMIIEEQLRPALVIGMPVGFVHVVEAKEMIMETDIPQVVLKGRRGGSPLAVAALHGILESVLPCE